MATSSCVIAAVVATLFLATCAIAATPPYKCYSFSSAGNGKRSHDKSGIRQLGKRGEPADCRGPECAAAIEPTGDIIREVGQPYEAYCLFDSTYIDASNVTLQHRGKLPQDPYSLPHTVVNASAIKVTVTPEEAESYSLSCAINSQYLCERTVNVGYRPQNVENFTCVSKNWLDLNCTWTVPNNPLRVQYNVTYVIPGFREQSECPTTHKHPNSCYWPNEIFSLNVKDEWITHFNASNKLEKGVVFKHSISIQENVLPNPVEALEAHVDGPNNITLLWILPHPMDTFKRILCEAAYRERFDGDVSEDVPWRMVDRWPVEPDRWNRAENFNKTISGLLAYKQYDFRVRIHTGFGTVRPHMWSEAAILTKRTSAVYPTVAPKTTKGTFEVEETLSYRDIYVSWQKVDSLYHNAPNFHYKIDAYDALNNRQIAKDEAEVDIKDSYAKFSNMEKDVTYRFEIIPMNDEGQPQEESVKALVLVPGSADLLEVPTFFRVIAYSGANRTVYSIRWRVDNPESQNVDTVTLYWCKKDKYEERCLNTLEWKVIQNPHLNVMNLTTLEETSLYMFGISVNSQNSSSGIKWITCIASYGNHPPPLEHFEVAQVSSHEVVLKWSLDCKAKAAEPIGFNISYCIVTEDSQECPPGAEKIFESIHDEAALEHRVDNLHPHTNYIFNIAILTQIGLSKWSKSEHVLTKPDKPSGPPQQFEVVESGQTWVSLSWKLPIVSERNGEVVEYEILWELGGKKKTVPANTTSEYTQFNVTDLDPYTNYNFEVTACTRIRVSDESCGTQYAPVETKTRIGGPSKIDDISQVDEVVKWDHDCSNGPSCFYQLRYTINSTEHIHETAPNVASINIRDLNITCTKAEKEIVVALRAITYNETKQKLFGPWKKESVTCYLTGLPWWIIVLIVAVASVIVIVVLIVGRYGWDKIKEFLAELKRKPHLPPGLEIEPPGQKKNNDPYGIWHQISRDNDSHEKSPSSTMSGGPEEPECQDLIPPGGERVGRNLSGDSGTSGTDPGDSSGCSTGGESDSTSASDNVHQSSDSGTGQEEPGFPIDGNTCRYDQALRLRTPYVRPGLPDGVSGVGYVAASSVPNLATGLSDASLSLHPFTTNGALGTLPEMPLGARTSTGYISMPDADADTISLDVLNNLTLAHDGRQNGFPAYSRHNFPYKKTTPEISPYTKGGSLPWLNTGYVAVSQAEGGRREATPQARGYVAVSDALSVMKRQDSLPSLSTGFTKSVSTPDEDSPPSAYCRVGSRSSPGPPAGASPGYVGITQGIPLHTAPNSLMTTSPTNKSPYVTCAIAEALVSPSSTPEKVSGGYVSVGDLSGGRWAHPVIQPDTGDEGRDVASAPVESSRGRPSVPTRPSTSEATVNHNRGGSRWPPLAPSLSKQSSGYVSQETLTFHDPVVMSPKRLLAQSHEPHSVVMSANHKASMV